MSNEYYIQNSGGEKEGPYTNYQLSGLQIALQTLVLPSSTNTWQKACDLPELNEYFEARGYWFPTEVNLASFWWRLLAYFIDVVIIVVACLFVLYFLITGGVITQAQLEKNNFGIQLAALGFTILYNSICEATAMRGSIGKKIIQLAVVDANGKRLTLANALLRNFSRIISSLPFDIGYLAIFWDSHRQAWHDQIAKTYVIKRDQV